MSEYRSLTNNTTFIPELAFLVTPASFYGSLLVKRHPFSVFTIINLYNQLRYEFTTTTLFVTFTE